MIPTLNLGGFILLQYALLQSGDIIGFSILKFARN